MIGAARVSKRFRNRTESGDHGARNPKGAEEFVALIQALSREETSMTGLNPRITADPGKMGGKPCIRGLRFTFYDLASYLASRMTRLRF